MRTLSVLLVAGVLCGGAVADVGAITYEEAVQQALISARGIRNDEDREASLALIAKGQAESGRMSEAIDTANQIESSSARGKVLAIIAELYVEDEDDAGEALALAVTIEDTVARDQALRDIAEWQAREQNYSEALETTKSIRDPANIAVALSDITELMAGQSLEKEASGLIANAREHAVTLESPAAHAATLVEVAKAQVVVEGIDKARETLEMSLAVAVSIENSVERARVVGGTVKGWTQVDIDSASQHLDKIGDPLRRALVLRELGKEYGLDGRRDDARRAFEESAAAAREIPDEPARARIVAMIAEFYIEQLQDLDGALELVELVSFSDGRDTIIQQLIRALGEGFRIDQHRDLLAMLSAPQAKVLGLLDVGKVHVAKEEMDDAARVVDEALRYAMEVTGGDLGPELTLAFVESFANIGDVAAAAEYASSFDRLEQRAAAFSALAEAMARDRRHRGPPHKR